MWRSLKRQNKRSSFCLLRKWPSNGFGRWLMATRLRSALLAAHPAVSEFVGLGPVDDSSSMRHRDDEAATTGCCCTALHLAAGQGHDQIVELLLDAKSSVVDATDFDGRTALHYAAKSSVDANDFDGLTIHAANSSPFWRVVKLLLAACPTLIDVVDGEGCTALLCAVNREKKRS